MTHPLEVLDTAEAERAKYFVPAPAEMSLGILPIGVMGKARSGKDTVASYLCAGIANKRHDKPWVKRYALADAVKVIASTVIGIPLDHFYDAAYKEVSSEFIANKELTPRKLAQLVGTESFRHVFGGQVWINHLHNIIANDKFCGEAVVIPDIRFPEEAEWIARQGGILVYLERDDAELVSSHSSEDLMTYSELVFHLARIDTDYGLLHIDNNGSIQELGNEIEKLIVPLLLSAVSSK